MQNKICPECKTENEPEYTFCKNCGSPLAQSAQSTDTYGAAGPIPDPYTGAVSGDTIDGNSAEEVCVFVGKNAPKIVPTFIRFEKIGSKTGWCWPAFLFGFFFGPVGAAIWFLYRKMYKVAAIFAAIGVFADYVSFALDRFFGIGSSATKTLENYFDDLIEGRIGLNGLDGVLTDKKVVLTAFAGSVYSAISIACAVIAGIFAFYLYKRHTAKAIPKIKSMITDTNYVKIALASKGGTSVGAVVVGLLITTFASNLPNTITSIIKAMGVLFKL